MKEEKKIGVIIPAFNEENSVGNVIRDIPKWVDKIVVVNNNSTDETKIKAENCGAIVIDEPINGYGRACLKGIQFFKSSEEKPDIIVFIDADYSDYREEMEQLVKPRLSENAYLVIGSRALGKREKGSMTIPQVFGNWLATSLLKLIYGIKYTDLGPFRAIKFEKLLALNMADKTYGWTVEMQLKAAKQKMKITEVPVNYRKRIGFSKISGTVKGTILAGYKILTTIFKYM